MRNTVRRLRLITMTILVLLWAAFPGLAAATSVFHAGYAEIETTDPVTGGLLRASVWYPTRMSGEAVKRGPFVMPVVLNAVSESGPFPLVTISHGNTGSHLGHRDTAISLARSGFIVTAPLHVGDNFLDQSLLGKEILLESRPKSISALLDTILADSRFPADENRIGFIGFSAGGYTGLALLGAKPAFAQAGKHCETYPEDGFCKFVSKDAGTVQPVDNLQDSRIKSATLLAPLTAFFTDDDLALVTTPTFLIYAEFDTILTEPSHASRLIKFAPGIQKNWKIEGAQHYSFLAPFPEQIKAELGELAKDRPGFDRVEIHKEMNKRIIAFFQQTL